MTYKLTLTEQDVATIAFVGDRYSWSKALSGYGAGKHKLDEVEAWALQEAFEEDTAGKHQFFPMLGHGPLRVKLYALMEQIV